MKALAVTRTWPSAGSSNGIFLQRQLQAVNALNADWQVDVLHLGGGDADALTERDEDGVRIFGSIPAPRRSRLDRFRPSPSDVATLESLIKDNGYQVVNFQFLGKWHWGAMARAARSAGAIPVRTLHHLSTWGSPYYRNDRLPVWLEARINLLANRGMEHYVAVSDLARDVAARHVPASRISVVINGVDPDEFVPHRILDGRSVRIVSTANLNLLKGLDDAIRGVAKAQQRLGADRDLTLEILGDGHLEAELRHLADELGVADRIVFRGRVSYREVAAALAQSDVFLLPSVFEAFGCAYLEAMASGLPVIATRHQGFAMVAQDRVNSYLVDERSPGQIADALVEICRHPDTARTVAGRGLATARECSWEASARELVAVYDRLVGAR